MNAEPVPESSTLTPLLAVIAFNPSPVRMNQPGVVTVIARLSWVVLI
jgi:hypothetical protein